MPQRSVSHSQFQNSAFVPVRLLLCKPALVAGPSAAYTRTKDWGKEIGEFGFAYANPDFDFSSKLPLFSAFSSSSVHAYAAQVSTRPFFPNVEVVTSRRERS